VTAIYDTRAEAEAARDRLTAAVDVEGRARIIDKTSEGSSDPRSGLHGLALSHEDRHAYQEGIRRGGFMLCAEVDSDERADKIVTVLEQTPSVDLEERQATWRSEGWQAPTRAAGAASLASPATLGSASTGNSAPNELQGGAMSHSTVQNIQEERIPIIEEQLVVGKREVSRGGARVRTYVREVPVQEQVTLREESVSVERRPVDQKLDRSTAAAESGLFQERTIEMTAMAEEAVVAKEARVTEEVVVRKTSEEHVEQIHDAVRRTEVDVEDGTSRSTSNDLRSSSDGQAFENAGRNR
jgi:uncharacterized protein (TIGR02271 family)